MKQPARLLVVDDEEGIRVLLTEYFTILGHPVASAANGDECMAALNELEDIRVVILDNRMPGVSGLDLLPKIKGLRPNIRVIMLTTLNSWDTAMEVLKLGGFEYLVKPVDLSLLAAAVNKCLKEIGYETH